MNVDTLVSMANQIGGFFSAMPDHDEALEGIATHIKKFWAPRMREALVRHWSEGSRAGLSPIVLEMLDRHSILLGTAPLQPEEPRPAAERHAWDGASES